MRPTTRPTMSRRALLERGDALLANPLCALDDAEAHRVSNAAECHRWHPTDANAREWEGEMDALELRLAEMEQFTLYEEMAP